MNLKSIFLTLAAGAAISAAGMYPADVTPWFSQSFKDLAEGAAFGGEGATSGSWGELPAGYSTVETVSGRKGITLAVRETTDVSVRFDANSVSDKSIERIDFAVCSEPTPWFPLLDDADTAALVLMSSGQDGVKVFGGYTGDGWVALYGHGLAQRKKEWLDCRAEFDYSGTEAYVTYYVRSDGGAYQPLVNASGTSRFRAAAAKVGKIVFKGNGTVGDFIGSGVVNNAGKINSWFPQGSDNRWDNPDNWSLGKVPDDGDIVVASTGYRIAYGKYTLYLRAETTFAIVADTRLDIGSGDMTITCLDDDFTSLGVVTLEPGATLRASGTYYGIEPGIGSTLVVETAKGLSVTGKSIALDRVNLDVSDALGEHVEAVALIRGPYGSGGNVAALTSDGIAIDCRAEWHGKLEGEAVLWIVNGGFVGDTAIWNEGTWGVLTNGVNWGETKPGEDVAARIGSGKARQGAGEAFAFARRFEVGTQASATGRVDMTGGRIDGAAVLVGAQDGAGEFDLAGGTVLGKDYLWDYALTVGAGTNAAGNVLVRGGTVDVRDGGISIGAEGDAVMSIESGATYANGPLAVGYGGWLSVSGGMLAGNGPFYIGRSTRGETYGVRMTVSGGVVSNASDDAIWVGWYGGVGSSALVSLSGGEIVATNRFVCGGYRSAQVDVTGGRLAAPEICVGYDLIDEEDEASFNLYGGMVETAGFTAGTNGERVVSLTGGKLVATTTNEDFFAGLDLVQLTGEATFENETNVTVKAAFMGAGGLVKSGKGTLKLAGYSAWSGETVVEEGVLDMDGGMVMGELSVAEGASVTHAKYDEIDAVLSLLTAQTWTSGTLSTRPYVYVEFSMSADGSTTVLAQDDAGITKGALSSVSSDDGQTFLGWTALGWTALGYRDGTSVGTAAQTVRMLFDFRDGKPYVIYYVKRGTAWERLVAEGGLSVFPVAGATMGIKTLTGVASYVGKQLYVADGKSFYWIGPDGGVWNDGGNWSASPDGEPGAATAYPKAGCLAFVSRPAEIALSADAAVALLAIHSDVRLEGGFNLTVSSAVSGAGRLEIAGIALQAAGTAAMIDVPLVVADGSVNEILNSGRNAFTVKSSIRGGGELVLRSANATRTMSGPVLEGDNSEFTGVIKIYPYWTGETSHQRYDKPSIYGPEASSANAQWEINVEHEYGSTMYPGKAFFGTAEATYRFGSLKANFYQYSSAQAYWAADGITLEVGALDMDGYALGACVGQNGVIDWIGRTATFTCGVTGLSALRLRGGGRLAVSGAAALPTAAITFADRGGELAYDGDTDISALFSGSTAPVVFDGGEGWSEWAGAPDASNVGGFVKRGAGTLVWYSAPSNALDVSVEQGVLIVPFGTRLGQVSVADGASLVVDCADAAPNAVIFSADGANRALDAPYLQFKDLPAGYTYRYMRGDGNSLIVANGSEGYAWTGYAEDLCWSTVGNWSVEGVVPSRPPADMDTVLYGAECVTTRLDVAAAALTVDALDALVLAGSYALKAYMRLYVAGTLRLAPSPMSQTEDDDDFYGAANRLGVECEGTFDVRALEGEGRVSVGGGDLVVRAEADCTSRFVGTLEAKDFIKRGKGTFDFIGDGAFSGAVSVEAGTLRIGSYRDIDGIRMDFDASDATTLSLESDGSVSQWTSLVGGYAFGYGAGQRATLTQDWFGGLNAVMLRPDVSGAKAFSRYDLAPANAPGSASKSLFVAYVPVSADDGSCLYSQVGQLNRGLFLKSGATGNYWSCPETGFGTLGIFSGLVYGGADNGNGVPSLVFWSDSALQDEAGAVESLGTVAERPGLRGAVGEVVSFSRTLTHAEREVTSRQLMAKWGVSGCTECAGIRSTTPVTMQAGATLDLGGQTVKVGSFTGAGAVQNGVLLTSDGKITQSGGDLVVPAVDGMTYVLSHAGQQLRIQNASGKRVKIVIPKSWFVAGGSGRCAVFCESDEIDWDIEVRDAKYQPVSEGDGWWSLPNCGFSIRLR